MSTRRLRLGRVELYIEPRDIWVGAYIAPDAVYICPLPLVVIKVERRFRDWSRFRLIPPPQVGRWHIVGENDAESLLVGRYRSRLVARLIASRLPRLSYEFDRFVVVRPGARILAKENS